MCLQMRLNGDANCFFPMRAETVRIPFRVNTEKYHRKNRQYNIDVPVYEIEPIYKLIFSVESRECSHSALYEFSEDVGKHFDEVTIKLPKTKNKFFSNSFIN